MSEHLRSRAERTGYAETSTWQDVIDFLDFLCAKDPALRREGLGGSHEGRELPFIVASDPPVTSPAEGSVGVCGRWLNQMRVEQTSVTDDFVNRYVRSSARISAIS